MVMHARKPQRMSDGYFEKHQAHPYQKYKERRAPNEYVGEGRYSPLRSPNGNMPAHGHHTGHSGHHPGHHHYSHCPEERGYPSRNTYVQKGCDKERDRDYKSSREKYTDVRSPKDKRSKESERERSNHERIDTDKKSRTSGVNVSVSRSNKYDKRSAASTSASTGQAGSEWSEHISSSGKKYYYNCISEISQWEKPREFDSRRTSSKDSTYSARTNHDKRSNSRSGRESEKPSKRNNSGSDRYWNSNSGRDEEGTERTRPKHTAHEDGQSLQDMDISPDRSTPLSEGSYRGRESSGGLGASAGAGAGSTRHSNAEVAVPPVVVLDNSNLTSGSLLAAALPRLVASANPAPSVAGAPGTAGAANNGGASPAADSAGSGTPRRDAGPPTPTHSENTDPHAPPLHLDAVLPRKSIMECLGSYSSVVGGALHAAAPMMTPSLVHYVRADLTAHVAGWPADLLEKQANKLTEDAYGLGCLQCTRVTAELKCTRSVVRHKEIQATLQEQKIMYLRQQISRLEELKSQNSFMSED